MDFSIVATEAAADRWTLRLGGVIEKVAARRLERAIEAACAASAREIVLDLAGVSFMDGSGLRTILRGRAICARQGCELMLSPVVRPPVRRLFELAGVAEEQPFAAPAAPAGS